MMIMFGAGGTGGHISPALSIARELIANDCKVCFVGNKNSLESKMCAESGLSFLPIYVQKLYRKITIAHLAFPYHLINSTFSVCKYIRQYRPDLVFCTGGFVSGPVAIAAIITKTPLYFHESNSFPGITIRLLGRYAKQIFTASDSVSRFFPAHKTTKVGIPINAAITTPHPFDPAAFGMSQTAPKLLIVGGSQGSLAINKTIDHIVPDLLNDGYEVFWQTGKSSYDLYSQKYSNTKGVFIFGFSQDLPTFYQNSTLAIARAGAMTISELEAVKLPAILIPLPTSAENHQYHNAVEQQQKGLAVLLEQKSLTPATLRELIRHLNDNHDEFVNRLNSLPENKSVTRIVSILLPNHNEARNITC
ncbi:MAG: undecaprenyldiphospho-muramoylpentapeptide beta-N-acetylglucosaminyltransferase [Candidatus Cloacimonetes bacterium HGW-Cloacimonetes-1]|jgi:UDP-N-acetylglucosamine--N-acetylmuramyl-(pentapeptide) pyrophosphoryl-undecaprenol N-acetylglucosamine transferase|nr:MAG: undecaprenyldiphospho-muramoylpentapeptide beta-N-acetylglucosaminyltransferase [Candidatus Cloacimonetes bacterium HGW-Cloacimonetes-1]